MKFCAVAQSEVNFAPLKTLAKQSSLRSNFTCPKGKLSSKKTLSIDKVFFVVEARGVAGCCGVPCIRWLDDRTPECAVPVSPLFAKKNPPGSFFTLRPSRVRLPTIQKCKKTALWRSFAFGGGEPPSVFNTLTRKELNSAYKSRQ